MPILRSVGPQIFHRQRNPLIAVYRSTWNNQQWFVFYLRGDISEECLFRLLMKCIFHRAGSVSKVKHEYFSNYERLWWNFLDDEGVYYWHRQTGTVTRERPDVIIDSPSSTLSSSSSNDFCFESSSFLFKSESNPSIKVLNIDRQWQFSQWFIWIAFRQTMKQQQLSNIVFMFIHLDGQPLTKKI